MLKFIADLGSNTNSSLERAKHMATMCQAIGFWGVKLQIFKGKKMYHNKDRVAELEKSEFKIEYLPEMQHHCDKIGIKLGATPFHNEDVSVISEYVDFLKISSFDANRQDLFLNCWRTRKPIIVSLGLIDDVEMFVSKLCGWSGADFNDIGKRVTLLHCVSNYPTSISQVSAKKISEIRKLFFGSYENIGYSDHSAATVSILAAMIQGARTIELHYDLNDMEGNEFKHGHCWSHDRAAEMLDLISRIELATELDHIITENAKSFMAKQDGFRD